MDLLSAECSAQSVGPTSQLLTLLIQTLISSYCKISPADKWPKDYGIEVLQSGQKLDDYDFVIVGAGSAGSVIANRLSENPDWKILLLEAGGDPPIESEIPLTLFTLQKTNIDWKYYTEPNSQYCQGANDGKCFWPRGKVLGGCSAINAMIYIRGNREDFDNWEAAGNPTWDFDSVLKYFKKSENIQTKLSFNQSEHGTEGPLYVDHFKYEYANITKLIFNAAKELGYEKVNDFSESQGYIGYTNILGTVKNGRRSSTAKAFLTTITERSNLHIIKHAHVKKIHFNNDQKKSIKSIEFTYKNHTEMTVNIKKEAILSAGAIGTPQLLMLSGIGPKKHLKKFNIPNISNLNVGSNLQDHVLVPIFFKIPIQNTQSNNGTNPNLIFAELYKFLMNENSKLSEMGIIDLVGFINTKNMKNLYPDIEYHHFLFQQNEPNLINFLSTIGYNQEIINSILNINKNYDILTVWTVLLKPKSLGKIQLKSNDYLIHPEIHPNYLHHSDDLLTILNGIKFQLKFLKTKSFQSHDIELMQPKLTKCQHKTKLNDDYWKCYIKYMTSTLYHPVGTCKMGLKKDPDAVVDAELNVYGVKGLRVGDASIMPDIVSANTNAATIMIGEKLADFVKKSWLQNNYNEKLEL